MADRQKFPGINCYHIDVIEEILVHLPVVDLLRCMQVCKLWLRLISSQEFRQKQAERVNTIHIFQVEPCKIFDPGETSIVQAIKHPPHEWMMMRSDDGGPGPGPGPISSSVARWHHHLSGDLQWDKHINGDIQILGSCDGLICFRLRDDRNGVVLFNPTTWKSKYICIHFPNGVSFSWFGRQRYGYGYGYGYTLVTGYDFNGCIGVESIDLHGPKSEIRYLVFSYEFYDRVGTLVKMNQTLYWPTLCGIVAYDLRNKLVFQISPPGTLAFVRMPFALGAVDSCLCVFILKQEQDDGFGPGVEMWMMRGESSWSKCRKIDGHDLRPIMYASFMVVLRKYTVEDEEGHGIVTRRLYKPEVVILHCCTCFVNKYVVFVKSLVSPQDSSLWREGISSDTEFV